MKWEYSAHRVYLKHEGRGKNKTRTWTMTWFDDELDRCLDPALPLLGQQGWELAGVQLSSMLEASETAPASIYLFKRPVADPG